MEFLSTYFRQQGQAAVPLLLQHYQYRDVQILFACICMGAGKYGKKAGSYMTEQLLQWFRGLNLRRLAGSGQKGINSIAYVLEQMVYRIDLELAESRLTDRDCQVSFSGIFCLGENYIICRRGAQRIYLINSAFGRAHIKRLDKGAVALRGNVPLRDRMYMELGRLQPHIGILLATEAFFGHVTEDMIKEGLFVEGLEKEEQMERHLRELVREGGRREELAGESGSLQEGAGANAKLDGQSKMQWERWTERQGIGAILLRIMA